MTRYGMVLEYDGSYFSGWQWQEGRETVQGLVEESVKRLWGEDVRVTGAGRTDTGVHARGQVAHVDIERPMTAKGVKSGLNYAMRDRGCVVRVLGEMRPDFHARFDARERGYCYRILNREAPPMIERGYVWHCPWFLDSDLMEEAGYFLELCEDFSSFRAAGCQARSSKRTIESFRVERRGEEIWFMFRARSFLYRQVRIMVGSLVDVGRGRRDVDWFRGLVRGGERKDAGETAPPWGLEFTDVVYDRDDEERMLFSIDKPSLSP